MNVMTAEPTQGIRTLFAARRRPGWDRGDEISEVYRVAEDLRELERRLERVRARGGRFARVALSPDVRRLVRLADKAAY